MDFSEIEKKTEGIQVLQINSQELKHMLKCSNPPVLIDVRQPEELKGQFGFLEGSVNIPLAQLETHLEKIQQYKDKEIVVICATGYRSHLASKLLKKAGFAKVFYLSGGMIEWNT